MSDKKTVILKGNSKKVTFDNGGSLINCSVNMEQLNKIHEWNNAEREKRELDSTDYLQLTVKEKREVDDYGNTHYIIFEPWFPEAKSKPKTEKGGSNDLPF